MARRIIYRPEFDDDCEDLGGIGAVQRVIAPIIELLETGNPSAFGFLEINANIRYAATRAIGDMPALIIAFEIDQDDDVVMISVDVRDF